MTKQESFIFFSSCSVWISTWYREINFSSF